MGWPQIQLVKEDWPQEKTLKLIKEFEKHECLWDVTSGDYRNVLRKKASWNIIAYKLRICPEEAEKKMKSVLSSYRREKKKVMEMSLANEGGETVYEPRWFGYNHLNFLHDTNRPKRMSDQSMAKGTFSDLDEPVDEEDEESENNYLNEFTTRMNIKNSAVSVQNNDGPRERKRIKTEGGGEMGSDSFASLEEEKPATRHSDEYSAFGEVVAFKLRKLSTEQERNIVQFKISEILFQASMGAFQSTVSDDSDCEVVNN